MFFIVNKTRGPVSIGDIGVTLGPRQAVDLDKIMKREKSEGSQSLKSARARGDIEVRVKDKSKPESSFVKAQPSVEDLGAFKKEMIGEMKDAMRELLASQQGGLSRSDLKELIDSMPKSSETVIYRDGQEKIREDEESSVRVNEIGEMNKRIVNKIVKNVDSTEIKYKEEKQKNDLDDNILELEGLLDL